MAEKDKRIEDLTGEVEDIISQLIDAKMANATYSYDLDEAKKRGNQLKRRVQTLGERVAVLEVAAAEAMETQTCGAVDGQEGNSVRVGQGGVLASKEETLCDNSRADAAGGDVNVI